MHFGHTALPIKIFLVCHRNVFPHGAIEIENPKNDNIFKVNGQRLKPFLENFSQEEESINLKDPIYQDLPSN